MRSLFLLADRGHEVEFVASEDALALEKYGVRSVDNLIIFSPHKKLSGVSKSDLLHFVESGGNLLLSSR